MNRNFHSLVAEMARQRPGAPAITARDTVVSYASLWQTVTAVGQGLRGAGAKDGDRVAVVATNRLETVAALFGASAAGCVAVPINPLLRPAQVSHVLADSGARVLVTTGERWGELIASGALAAVPKVVVLLDAGEVEGDERVRDWESLLADAPATAVRETDRDPDGPAMIIYTSGSTGRAKGVVLSHRNLLTAADSVNAFLGHTADDVLLGLLPLSFDAGFSQLTTAFRAGAQVVLADYLFPAEVVRLCARHRVTGILGVPALWARLADQAWDDDAVAYVRYFGNTGGHLPGHTLDRLRLIFPEALPYLMYGLTEAFRSTYLDPAQVDVRPGSIGKAIPFAEVRVVRPDGVECAPGEIGELVQTGPLVALGYWNDPAATAARFRPVPGSGDGSRAVWSGDLVVRDEEGYLSFIARSDDMIKTRGYRVSPTEVEEAVAATGMVQEAVAFGFEPAGEAQRIALAVTACRDRPVDRAALLARLRRDLPRYMVPESIVVLPTLPMSPNGKYDRAALREALVP